MENRQAAQAIRFHRIWTYCTIIHPDQFLNVSFDRWLRSFIKKGKKRKKERKKPPSSFLKREKIGRNYRCKIDIVEGSAKRGWTREENQRNRITTRSKQKEILGRVSPLNLAQLFSKSTSPPPFLSSFFLFSLKQSVIKDKWNHNFLHESFPLPSELFSNYFCPAKI